jgi:3-isopropylmalate dehydrogenase
MKLLVLPGDGIGPEITEATLAVLDQASKKFKLGLEWDQREIGFGALKKHGSTFPETIQEAARKAPGIILGPVDHLQYPNKEQGGINP